jgi:hypothetical protein
MSGEELAGDNVWKIHHNKILPLPDDVIVYLHMAG